MDIAMLTKALGVEAIAPPDAFNCMFLALPNLYLATAPQADSSPVVFASVRRV